MSTRRTGVLAHAFVLPGLLLVLVALGGRYTLDRAGLTSLQWVDLRVPGLTVGLALLTIDLVRRPSPHIARRPEGWLVVATLFFLYQVASGLWAPPGARVGEKALDVVLMGALTLAIYLYTLGDPVAVIRWTFLFFYVAAVVFALGALLVTGPGDQGRYAAFGGGPNVFVRIEILGIISAVALYRLRRRKLVFLGLPLFLLAAVLSGSRAGLLAGVIVGGVALLRARRRLAAGPTLLAVLVAVGAAALFWTHAPRSVTALVDERFVQQTVEQGYLSGRTTIWWDTIELALHHPIIGTGLDGFYGLIGRVQDIEYPHQYVLAVAAEGGVIGLGLLCVSVVLWTVTVRRGGGHPVETGLTVASASFVAISSLFSGDYYDARLAWLFGALAAAAAITGPAAAGTGPSGEASWEQARGSDVVTARVAKPNREQPGSAPARQGWTTDPHPAPPLQGGR
jgi:O-antigen ligase